jgi:hypothetical protein
VELTFAFLELAFQVLLHSLKLLDVLAGVVEIVSQRVSNAVMPLFKGSDVLSVDGNEPVLKVL